MSLGFQATKVGLMIATPLLLAALAAGLLVSILQASTQINEMTLSFIPKILTLVVVLIAITWCFHPHSYRRAFAE